MKPKIKKRTIDDEVLSFFKLIESNKKIINNLQKNNKLIKHIDLILNIKNNIELFLIENDKLLYTFKKELNELKIYENWMRCYLELFINFKKQQSSFLSKLIEIETITPINVVDEIYKCVDRDIILYFGYKKLELHINKDNKSNRCELFDIILNLLNIVKDVTKNEMKNKDITINNINVILDSLKTNIIDKKFSEFGIYNWNVIRTKVKSYILNTKPFDILNIRQQDDIELIINGISKTIKNDINNNFSKLDTYYAIKNDYERVLAKIKLSKSYKSDTEYRNNAQLILDRNINTCSIIADNITFLGIQYDGVLKSIKNIEKYENDLQKQLDILCSLNHFIFDYYQLTLLKNSDLNIKSLQTKDTCCEYLKSFTLDTKWNDICLSIRNYLYFKNIKKMSSIGEYKAIKCLLKPIIKSDKVLAEINRIVLIINKIIERGYLFIKLYALHVLESKKQIVNITDFDLISMSIRTITINDSRGSNMGDDNKELLKELDLFYDSHFKKIYGEKINAIGFSQILNFAKTHMVTAYKNNITMNYCKYVKHYIYSCIDEINKEESFKLNKTDKTKYKKELRKQSAICLTDIITGNVSGTYENMKCSEEFKEFIIKNKESIIPQNVDYSKKGIESDVENNPIRYFEKMIFMNSELEKMERKMFCCFPLRTSLVPSNIDLDTLSLITLFINKNDEDHKKQGISKILKDNISIFYEKIWNEIVKLDNKEFKWNDKYKFDHHIITDGISVTILFKHIDMNGLEIKSTKKKNNDNFKYVDKLGETENGWDEELMKNEMKKISEMYNLVLVDPGKNPDLLYMCNYAENTKDINYFKYTTKQRLHEMGTIKHRKIIQTFKKEHKIHEQEQKLGIVSSKTCDMNKFLAYIKNKKEVCENICKYYEMPFLRKMNMRSHINKLRSESKLVNNIKSIFGKDKRGIMLIYGDWSRLSQMKGVISTPCIGLKRRLLENFKILNINEFRTSCLDNISLKANKNAEVYNFKTGRVKTLHSVLVSKIPSITDGKSLTRFQNRNRNSVLNMRNIIECYKKEGIRKFEFTRNHKLDNDIESPIFNEKLGNTLTVETSTKLCNT